MLKKGAGSVTVFLTILFLLFFSLVGVAFENARVLSSKGYVRTAAHSTAMTVFGNYNKELYEDYGFFAYGGCDGMGVEELAEEFTEELAENMRTIPRKSKVPYSNLYRIQELDTAVMHADMLSDREVFIEQVEAYLKSEVVEDITDKLLKKESKASDQGSMQDKLELTKEYESGKFNQSKESGIKKGMLAEKGSSAQSKRAKSKIPEKKAEGFGSAEERKEDAAKGNPLITFKNIMRDGVLNLVCDADSLSDGMIKDRNMQKKAENTVFPKKENEKTGAADYLKDLLGETSDVVCQEEETQKSRAIKSMDKVKYICYANRQFGCYTEDKQRTTKYGREYLVAGKQEERDNLSKVVNKLLGIRLLINFASIVSDAVLQEKSLTTATILAGFTGMPPVIQAVQYTILLILAFEEACIDVTALLEGRKVPTVKGVGTLKMKYEEICLATKRLFAKKAKEYPTGEASVTDITYEQYLWLFLLGQSEDELHNRSLNLIQYDLREKYNQTFEIETCICNSRYAVHYSVPYIFERLPFLSGMGNGAAKELEVEYGYKSG